MSAEIEIPVAVPEIATEQYPGTALLRQRLAVIAQDSPLERSAQKLAHIKQLFFNAFGFWPGQRPSVMSSEVETSPCLGAT